MLVGIVIYVMIGVSYSIWYGMENNLFQFDSFAKVLGTFFGFSFVVLFAPFIMLIYFLKK